MQRLETTLTGARGQKQTCSLLAVRIGNIEAIYNDFGRDSAEKAIVVAASHLRRAMTDLDLAARVGDYEFAVLLDSPVGAEAAMSRAQQVVASGLRQVSTLPQGLTLKFHVAVALLPHQEADAETCLAWALEGLAAIPLDARKLIRALNF